MIRYSTGSASRYLPRSGAIASGDTFSFHAPTYDRLTRFAGYRLESPQVAQDCARALLARAGPERLLWGSDWPFAAFEDRMRYEHAIASLKEWIPDANLRHIISGETALRLFFA